MQSHNISYTYKFISQPLNPIKWDKEVNLKNGVTQYYLKYPFKEIGSVTFERMKAKYTDDLYIYFLKEIWMDTNQLNNYEKIIYTNCQQCANWFMKRYNCKLEPIGLHQKPHFAYLNTIEAKILSKFGNFNLGFST